MFDELPVALGGEKSPLILVHVPPLASPTPTITTTTVTIFCTALSPHSSTSPFPLLPIAPISRIRRRRPHAL